MSKCWRPYLKTEEAWESQGSEVKRGKRVIELIEDHEPCDTNWFRDIEGKDTEVWYAWWNDHNESNEQNPKLCTAVVPELFVVGSNEHTSQGIIRTTEFVFRFSEVAVSSFKEQTKEQSGWLGLWTPDIQSVEHALITQLKMC